MGPKHAILLKQLSALMENHKIVNKDIKGVKSEKIKVKTRFCDKDLSSVILFSKTDDFTNTPNSLIKTYYLINMINLLINTYYFINMIIH